MANSNNQTKYNIIKEYLREEMLMGRIKPGDRIPSENILTGKFSMSRHTVRKAIDMLANEGFVYTEHGRGTFCLDRNKKADSTRNIGVITTYISEYIFPSVILGIDGVLSKNGYSIILKNTGNSIDKEALCLEDMLAKNVDGIIVEPTKSALFSSNLKYYEAMDNRHIPYVFIHGCYRQMEEKPQVIMDDVRGMYSVVEYLVKLGHRKITGVFKADDIQGLNRHKGYAKALADYGLSYDPYQIIWFHTEDKEITPSVGVKALIKSGMDMDAVVCYNDEIACMVFEALKEMGIKVPEDVSLTGFDDSYLALGCPVKLTTASHPKEKLGAAAAELLLGLLERDKAPCPVNSVMAFELLIRDSCKSRL